MKRDHEAKLVVHDGAKMPLRKRKAIAAWLREQAAFLTRSGHLLAPRFTARYMKG